MNNLIPFIIKSSLSLLVLYGYYYLVLKKTTNYEINRFYLLFSLLFSISIPFMSFNLGRPTITPEAHNMMTVLLEEIDVVANYNKPIDTNSTLVTIMATLYIIGALFLSFKLLYGLYSIKFLINKNNRYADNNFKIIKLSGISSSFSFFKYIFIGEVNTIDDDDVQKVIAHEKIHARQLHSLDIILVEIVTIILWINPLIWFIRKAIKDNHEYIADNEVIKKYPAGSYLQLLLNQTTKANISYGNCFAYSNIKKRMIMISKKTSGKYSLARYIPAVITVAALFISFACSNELKEEKTNKKEEITALNPEEIASMDITKTKDGVIITAKTKDGRIITEEKKVKDIKIIEDKTTKVDKETAIDEVFVIVEEMPEFPGGSKALLKYISKNVKYPKEAQKKGIEGRVFVSFVVNEDGTVTKTKILKKVNPELEKEALRVVNSMPKWKPGKQRGINVKVSYTIPINFALK